MRRNDATPVVSSRAERKSKCVRGEEGKDREYVNTMPLS